MRKLGINCDCVKDCHPADNLEFIKAAGFDNIFSKSHESTPEVTETIAKRADELGLEYEFIHAPFSGINNMWLSGMDYLGIYEGMRKAIDCAVNVGVKIVVLHVSSGWKAPEINDLGLARFDSIVEYAIKKGVVLAFENLRKVGNLAYFTDRYANLDNVRYCYDFGHSYCYTPTIDWMDIFREKMIVTHIHDNFGLPENMGDGDIHLLPFDGNLDYSKIMRKLDEYKYDGALTLEVSNKRSESYMKMAPEAFIRTAYERVKRVSEILTIQ